MSFPKLFKIIQNFIRGNWRIRSYFGLWRSSYISGLSKNSLTHNVKYDSEWKIEWNMRGIKNGWQKMKKNEGTVELVHTCMSLVHHVIQRFLLCIPSHFLVHAWIEQTDLWMFSRHVKNTNIEVNQNLITDKSFLFVVRNFWRYTCPGWLLELPIWKFNFWNDVNEVPVKPAGHWHWFGFMHTPSFKQGESQTGDEQSLPDQPLSQEHLTNT